MKSRPDLLISITQDQLKVKISFFQQIFTFYFICPIMGVCMAVVSIACLRSCMVKLSIHVIINVQSLCMQTLDSVKSARAGIGGPSAVKGLISNLQTFHEVDAHV